MADKKLAQKQWELRVQQMQEELDTRELMIQSQEKKFMVLQCRADEMLRREELLKFREDRAAQSELRAAELTKMEEELCNTECHCSCYRRCQQA